MCSVGSGPRYMICVTRFARCARQKTYGHVRSTRYSRMAVGFLTHTMCKNVLQNVIPLATA